MIRTRTLVIVALGAALFAAPESAQSVMPLQAGVQPSFAVDAFKRPFRFPLETDLVSAPADARDFSRYRGFRLGMSLATVAAQTGLKAADARLVHQRPAVIQELTWHAQHAMLTATPQTDPVSELVFTFYNGELCRVMITYDRYKTEGMTDQDIIEAISTQYGAATRPAATIAIFGSAPILDSTERVIARWEDAQYSFNLFRSSDVVGYGLLGSSKTMDVQIRAAMLEAIRLDAQEAPQREADRQKTQDDERNKTQAQSRIVNKAAFRP